MTKCAEWEQQCRGPERAVSCVGGTEGHTVGACCLLEERFLKRPLLLQPWVSVIVVLRVGVLSVVVGGGPCGQGPVEGG